jgi:hypothetical protein
MSQRPFGSNGSDGPSGRRLTAIHTRLAGWVAHHRARRKRLADPEHPVPDSKTYASERHLGGIGAELTTRRGPR